jgi:drug/metabolite transporter (DMT)-like permease
MISQSSSTNPSDKQPVQGTIWTFVMMGVLGHLIFGAYPVVAKRAIAEVPKFSLLFLSTFATLLASLWLIRRSDKRAWREILSQIFHSKALWGLVFFVIVRSVSNITAIDMTRATWVQLIYLLTPFAVPILGTLFFDEPTPRYTYRALLLSTFGAVLVLVTDWSDAFAGFTSRDMWGLALAAFSMLTLATYFQMVRRSSRRRASSGMILLQQNLALASTYLILTLTTGEDWGQWQTASPTGLIYALTFIFGIMMLGNILQVSAIGGASPALITSLMPLRLIVTIALGWIVLGEYLTEPWQWAGAAIVLITVSGYLWLQSRDQFRSAL